MLRRIISNTLILVALFSGSSNSMKYPEPFTKIDEDIYRDNLIPLRWDVTLSMIAPHQDSSEGSTLDLAMIAIDTTFLVTKQLLEENEGSMLKKMKLVSDCGFFDLVLVLLNHPNKLINWMACTQMSTFFISSLRYYVGYYKSIIVDKLFQHNIVQRVFELASSSEKDDSNNDLVWAGEELLNTDKQAATMLFRFIIEWSKDIHIDALVESGALDVVCRWAQTLQPPDEDKILLALEAASKLRSVSHRPGEQTLKSKDDFFRQAKLCDASENYCRYHYCGKWKKIGLLLSVCLFGLSSVAAFLWLLWTSLDPAKSKKKNLVKDSDNKKEVDKQDENKCAKCGKIVPVSGIKECSKCGVVYCSRSCQKADWPNHKQMCKLLREVKNASSETEAIEQIAKLSTNAKNGIFSSLMMTHVGWVSTDTNEELPPGLPENFLYIHEAMNKYASLGKKKREFGEAIYRRLFDELVENEEEWEDFFSHPENHGHIGDAAVVLETLADIYEARKSLEECGLILDVQSKALEYLKGHCEDFEEIDADDKWIQFCASSEHHLLCTRFTINEELNRYEDNVPVIRDLTVYEEGLGNSHMHTWKTLTKVWDDAMQQNLSDKSILDISDETVLEVYLHGIESDKRMRSACPAVYKIIDGMSGNRAAKKKQLQYQKHVELLSCAYCNKKETALGQHKQCRRCNHVVYCSKKCQSLHWKKHKKECNKKK